MSKLYMQEFTRVFWLGIKAGFTTNEARYLAKLEMETLGIKKY